MSGNKYEKIFSEILNSKFWSAGETICGSGSKKENTHSVVSFLDEFIEEKKITSILDLGCGDLNWIGESIKNLKRYIGVDLGFEMLEKNGDNFPNFKFHKKDILSFMSEFNEKNGQIEVIICRDVLVHLDIEYVKSFLQEVSNSKALYFITTSFPESYTNSEIQSGQWRPIDITKEPFNFEYPYSRVSEEYSGWGEDKLYKDKSIYVFNLGENK